MENQSGQKLISNILAVAGFIILIAIIVWGAFHFLNLASSGFSSLFNRSGSSTIKITSPAGAQSGQPFDVSWTYTPTDDGSYAFLYQCREGFQFRVIAATSTLNVIPCGSAYTIGTKTTKGVRLVPVLTSSASADIAFSIVYMSGSTLGTSTSSGHAQGNASITITNPAASGSNTDAQPTGSNQGSQPRPSTPPRPIGPADLSVRILSVGVIDPISGNIIKRAPISPQEIVAVTFDIKNGGGTATGPWYFTAQLPTMPVTPYSSPQQRSLNPGDHIENTLRFNQAAQGGMFMVSVDPTNMVAESNEGNNAESQSISGTYYK